MPNKPRIKAQAMTRPSAKQIAREFQGGTTMSDLWNKYPHKTLDQIADAIRKYVKIGGRNER